MRAESLKLQGTLPTAIHGEDNMKELCGVNDMVGLQLGHPAQFSQQLGGEGQQGIKRKACRSCHERSPQVHAGKAAN